MSCDILDTKTLGNCLQIDHLDELKFLDLRKIATECRCSQHLSSSIFSNPRRRSEDGPEDYKTA